MPAPGARRSRRPGPVLRFLFRVPELLWRLGFGRLLWRWFLLLEHRGRKTGQLHRAVLEVVARSDKDGEVYAASGFGKSADWFRNVQAEPDVTIETAGRRIEVEARVLADAERTRVFALYEREHPWRRRFFERELGADLPVVGSRVRAGG